MAFAGSLAQHVIRVSALILLVPLTYKPPSQADSAAPLTAWVENIQRSANTWVGHDDEVMAEIVRVLVPQAGAAAAIAIAIAIARPIID